MSDALVRLESRTLTPPGGSRTRFIAIQVSANEPAAPAPVSIAIALDRSSSMHGAPLATAKRAACDVVRMLDDDARIALVMFDRQVETVVAPRTLGPDRHSILEAIQKVDSGYGTDLGAATRRVLDLAKPWGPTARALLLTDGCPFVGELSVEGLGAISESASSGVPMTTIGFGSAVDYHALHALGTRTTGRVLQLSATGDPRLPLGTEIGSARAAVAFRNELRVDLAPGVRLVRAQHRGPATVTSSRVVARLAPIGPAEPARLVLEVEVDADTENALLGSVDVLALRADGEKFVQSQELGAAAPGPDENGAHVDVVLASIASAMVDLTTNARRGQYSSIDDANRIGSLSELADGWGIAGDARVRSAFAWYTDLLRASRHDLASCDSLVATIDGIERQYEARFDIDPESRSQPMRTRHQVEGERRITLVSSLPSLRRR